MTPLRQAAGLVPILAVLANGCGPRSPSPARPRAMADLVVLAQRIYTADSARPVAEALAVRNGRIAYVGDRKDALALRGTTTTVLDLPDRTIIPGSPTLTRIS